MHEVLAPTLTPVDTLLRTRQGDVEDLLPGDVALAGYFCDCLSSPAPGQRFLARQIRYLSDETKKPMEGVLDIGDVNVFPLEPEKHMAVMEHQISLVYDAGARLCLVGGDASGFEVLSKTLSNKLEREITTVHTGQGESGTSDLSPAILAVDLSRLAGSWMSRPQRLGGVSPLEIITEISAIQRPITAAAIYGLAPTLGEVGVFETRVSRDVLAALVDTLKRRIS